MTGVGDLGLMLLHALPLDGRMWAQQRDILPNRTCAPNLYQYGDACEQWARACIREMPAYRCVVVGCSVGGSCALEILNRAPERVAALILIGTKARHDPDPVSATDTQKLIETQGVSGAWDMLWAPLFSDQLGAACVQARAIALAQTPQHVMQGLRAFHTRSSREDVVANAPCPVHIVSGDHDTLPGLGYGRRLAGLSPRAQMHVIPNCGHYAPMDQPRATTRLIQTVIAQVAAQ